MGKNSIDNILQACAEGNAELLENLLSSNPKAYNTVLFKQSDLLNIACSFGHVECAKALLALGATVNRNPNSNFAPLHCACNSGHPACAQLLIDHGAQVDEVTEDFEGCDQHGITPLHLACDHNGKNITGFEECIRLLVEKGANINAQDPFGKTPLHYAYNNPNLIMILLELGADITIRDSIGYTVLERIHERHKSLVEYYMKLLSEPGGQHTPTRL
jgi:ankyrin repeat protein